MPEALGDIEPYSTWFGGMDLRVTVVGGTGFPLAEAGAYSTHRLPHAPPTVDQGRLMKTDKVIRDPQRAPVALRVRPRLLESSISQS